jgi:DNA helicase HerA-like ATPase
LSAQLQSSALSPLFRHTPKQSVFDCITTFLGTSDKRILRISLEHVQFDYSAREIIANSLGRDLLNRARRGELHERPVVVLLDEAHQFLNRKLGDEENPHHLDAFELIAKEGRKYWLTICMATQRPRDIPDGVLSQMGTLIVHRLINDRDREVVERAAGEIDRSAAAFLPTLGPGEAAVIGVDFPMPLTMQMQKPSKKHEPSSSGPGFQECWKVATPTP